MSNLWVIPIIASVERFSGMLDLRSNTKLNLHIATNHEHARLVLGFACAPFSVIFFVGFAVGIICATHGHGAVEASG